MVLIHTLHKIGKNAEALVSAREAVKRWPETSFFQMKRVALLYSTGEVDEARRLAREWVQHAPSARPVDRAYLCAAAGEREQMDAALVKLGGLSLFRATLYAVLGDKETALEWMRRAADHGHRLHPKAVLDAELRMLLDGDPCFAALVKRLRGE